MGTSSPAPSPTSRRSSGSSYSSSCATRVGAVFEEALAKHAPGVARAVKGAAPATRVAHAIRGRRRAATSFTSAPSYGSPAQQPTSPYSNSAALWGLSPKVMVVTEQKVSHSTPGLTARFMEALNYYVALFDCLEVGTTRGSAERARVERWFLGEEIKNIVGCNGVEWHEQLERWARRMEGAGFTRVPLSYYALRVARRLGCDGFKVCEEDTFFLCWQDRTVFSVPAWRGRRFN